MPIADISNLKTVQDLVGEMGRIDALSEPERTASARAFMEAYRAATPFADANIGYFTGYFDADQIGRLQQLFKVEHPVFGHVTPTPQEALQAGLDYEPS